MFMPWADGSTGLKCYHGRTVLTDIVGGDLDAGSNLLRARDMTYSIQLRMITNYYYY